MAVQSVPSSPNFVELEASVLKHWHEHDSFNKLRKLREDAPLFRFVDGPITANNPMGVHHAWGRTLKDAFIRYKAMTGHACKYQNGFDCQGLWVEVEVEKELNLGGKPDIERFGLDKFSHACKARIEKFSKVISDQSARLGQWMDWDDSYYTHTDGNILGIWAFLKKCHGHGWLCQKGLPMPWCPRCGTSLSEHEMSGSYKDMEHLSVFVQVPLKDGSNRRLVLWTTTPWTLSANVAAAVNPKLNYVEVSAPTLGDAKLILCESAVRVLRAKHTVERTFKGEELLGLEYETFFPEFEAQAGVKHRVIPWDAVDATEGSGIVHIAPGCGKEDYQLGKDHGLPAIVPINENGVFHVGFGDLTGKFAGDVSTYVADRLKAAGKLIRSEMYAHSYPICWRCKGELLFRLVDEWFIRCDEIRPRMLEAARTVEWMPDYTGKRMEDWLHNMGDWCISRKRFWGLPLPFYPCKECGHLEVLGSKEELKAKAIDPAKVDAIPELHRPWIDDIAIACPKCAKPVNRVVEVGDCWLDAGIVPFATLDYWTNRDSWQKRYPVEWVCEMREQVRLWFYSMLFMSVTLEGRSPYQKVLAYERVVDEEGEPFSKTKYMIRFDEAAEKMGVDVMRFLYCSQPVNSELRFGYTLAEKTAKRRLIDLWNIYAFFSMYAEIDQPDLSQPAGTLHLTDRWLLARTAKMLEVVSSAYQAWDTPAVLREIEPFLEDVSTWYVRVNRRRFWRSGNEDDKRACYGALFACLKATITVLAPIVPFVTESIWQNLVRGLEPSAPESVHHSLWPVTGKDWANPNLLVQTERVRQAISIANNVRSQIGQRVRQPLAELWIVCPAEEHAPLQEQLPLIQAELNVKRVTLIEDAASLYVDKLVLKHKEAGPILRGDVGKVKGLIDNADPTVMAQLVEAFNAGQELVVPGYSKPIPPTIFAKDKGSRPGLKVATESGLTIALDTVVTDALRIEGLARDLVRHLQVFRKESGLDVDDKIELGLSTTDPELTKAIAAHRASIAEELLAIRMLDGEIPKADATATLDLEPAKVTVRLRRIARD